MHEKSRPGEVKWLTPGIQRRNGRPWARTQSEGFPGREVFSTYGVKGLD